VRRVSDAEQRVRALVIAYAERLDAGDLDGVAALFEHAVVHSGRLGDLHGSAAVRGMYEPVVIYDDGTPRTKHVLGNLQISVDESGETAESRCNFTVLQAAPDAPLQPVLAGRYHDRFVRDGDEWRYAERTIIPDLMGDLSLHMGRA